MEIPYEVNDTFQAGWWKPMVKVGDDTYIAYTSPAPDTINGMTTHYANVAKKNFLGIWTTHRLQSDNGSGLEDAVFIDDSGHNQTSLAIDGNGNIHVWTSMHNSPWCDSTYSYDIGYGHYYRSDTPGDITSMTDRSTEMPNQATATHPYQYTYPIACTDSVGDVYLIIRRREGSNAPLVMYRWDKSAWSIVGRVADNSDPTFTVYVYPDDLVATSDGLVHLAFSWHKNSASSRRHRASYLSYNPSTGTFKTADGVNKTIPVAWTNTNLVYQPLVAGEETDDDDPLAGHQTARLAISPGGTVNIAYRFRALDYQVNNLRWAKFVNGSWILATIWTPGNYEDTLAAVEAVHTGSLARVYYVRDSGGRKRLWKAESSTDGWTHSQVADKGIERVCLNNGQLYGVIPACGKQFLI